MDAGLDALLGREYGLAGRLQPLGGENRNFRLDCPDGRRFVLKLHAGDVSARAAMEHAAVEHATPAMGDVQLPRTVRTRAGALTAHWEGGGGRVGTARLFTYLEGTPWEQARSNDRARWHSLGHAVATLDRALETFTNPMALQRHRWDLASAGQHRARVRFVESAVRRRLVEQMFHWWAALAAPRLNDLPHTVIHGDMNDENVLVDGNRVVGVLDFGDALLNPTVCNLAIALAYAMLDTPDPVAAGAHVVAGYQSVRPLRPGELEVLFPLVCGRLATTVVTAAERRRIDPHHSSWFVTEDRAWRLIEKLAVLDPEAAGCGLQGAGAGAPRADRRESRPAHGVEHAVAVRHRHISRALSIAYREPLEIVRGAGQYLFDRRGRPYLDLVNNVAHVGHCHPRVIDAAQRQMARLNTNTRYLYGELHEYAERLAATLPPPLDVCFFVNSGSEANELALRLARAHTGRRDVIVVEGAYHGNTSTLIAVSPYKFMGQGGAGVAEPWVHVAPVPDAYRRRHRDADRPAGEAYGGEVASLAGPRTGAFLVESLMSCAGQVLPPPGYLDTAFRAVRSAGGVCIVDEVQVGFGRVGSQFWGFQLQHVVPDIVVMGKPMGNGHPIGAVATTREIAASFENGMEFFSTFGGNPVSCAIGLAVLDVIRDERLQERAQTVGAHFEVGLRDLAARHPIVGDVRGAGLFLGVELVRDRGTREPATAEAADLINRVKDRGILLSTDGPFDNVLKIKPPLVLTEDDVEMAVRILDDELGVSPVLDVSD